MHELIALTLLFSSATAQETAAPAVPPYDDLIVTSPDLAAARAAEDAAAAELRAARGARLPQLRIEGRAGSVDETLRIDGLAGSFSTRREPVAGSAIIEQSVFTSGRLSGSINAAAAERDAAAAETDAARQDILLLGIVVAADLVRDRDILRVREKGEALARQRLAETQARRAAGVATVTDVSQSEARASLAAAERIAATGSVAKSEAVFARVYGSAAAEELSMPSPPANLPASLEIAIEAALEANPDLQAAFERSDAARHAVVAARGARLPQIGLEARADYADRERIGETLGEVEQYGVFVTGRVALWSGGTLDARTTAAKARASAARSRFTAAQRSVREFAIASYTDVSSAKAIFEARRAQVAAATSAQRGVAEEFDTGRRSRLDVLDADLELADAEVALLGARRDLVVAQYSLLRAVGRL